MSYADDVFIKMCQDILENGTSTEGEKVRPVWEDGTPAYTIKKFGVVNRYDLRKEFPAMTLRRTALKSAMDDDPLDMAEEIQQYSMIFTAISGTAGQMRVVLSVRHMGISLA